MTFMFFESPHAKYYFPAETIIRQPYLEDFNYATMDLKNDITLIKNRYINSCNHLDTQINQVVRYLEDNELMDSTIVLITGDHGEEFMEKGHWGHGSAFTEEQVHVPLILWIPGKPPRKVTSMTSHLDIPATLLPLLGVYNRPEDYSLGYDLFGERKRTFTVLSDWNNLVYMDQDYTAIFPLKIHGVTQQEVTTKKGSDLPSDALFYNTHKTQLLSIMAALEKFSRH